MKIREALNAQPKVLYTGDLAMSATVDSDDVLRWSEFPKDGMAVPLCFLLSDSWELQPAQPKQEVLMFKNIKITYQNTGRIDEKFDKELTAFIEEKTGTTCYATGYSLMDGWRDMVFDNRKEKE